MTFESEGLLIVAIYMWLPSASYVVFLTTLVIDINIDMYAPLIKSEDDATFQLILRHLFVRGWKKNLRETGRDLTQSFN